MTGLNRDAPHGFVIIGGGGRYVDVLQKRHGEWRIADRVVVIEWQRIDKNLGQSNFPRARFMAARRDRGDIAYGRTSDERNTIHQ